MAVKGYQLTLGTVLPPSCRYWPSCSAYAIEALQVHGARRGSWLTLRRLCRCHPWGGEGFDPVPPASKDPSFFASGDPASPNRPSSSVMLQRRR
ncbi:MAG: membrane protein insertion efficiency factor YidD [Lautropia sp.]|nr:membrane protein insertion efficiency factor YidD [Lautropia sp.]